MKFVVSGYNILDDDEVIPVEVRCPVCGSSAVMGEHDYGVFLDELNQWAAAHECPRNLRVT